MKLCATTHDKVDDMHDKVGEITVSTGFLASMTVRMSRVLDTIVDDEMDMPRLLRLVPDGPVTTKLPPELISDVMTPPKLKEVGRKKARKNLKEKFSGKAGAASRMIRRKLPSGLRGERWRVQFLCAYDFEPVDCGLTLNVPGGWMIHAYPIMKIMVGLLCIARIASSSVNRLVEAAGIQDLPTQGSMRGMREMVMSFEAQIPSEKVKDIDDELEEQMGTGNTDGIKEVAPEMYHEIIRLLNANHHNWRTLLHGKMRRVVGEDARVHWVSHDNMGKFTSAEASNQRMMSLQEDHTKRLIDQHMQSMQMATVPTTDRTTDMVDSE